MTVLPELAAQVQRWALHCTERPQDLEAQIQRLRCVTGATELDAHNALLADVLQGVHRLITERSA